jgi:hypothetical protein
MHGKTPQGWSITLDALVHQTRVSVRPDAPRNVPAGMARVLVRIVTPVTDLRMVHRACSRGRSHPFLLADVQTPLLTSRNGS